MNLIRNWWNNRKKQEETMITKAIRNEFAITEKSGTIFLTHNDVAFMQIDSDAKAADIAELLNTARDTAQTYRSL